MGCVPQISLKRFSADLTSIQLFSFQELTKKKN